MNFLTTIFAPRPPSSELRQPLQEETETPETAHSGGYSAAIPPIELNGRGIVILPKPLTKEAASAQKPVQYTVAAIKNASPLQTAFTPKAAGVVIIPNEIVEDLLADNSLNQTYPLSAEEIEIERQAKIAGILNTLSVLEKVKLKIAALSPKMTAGENAYLKLPNNQFLSAADIEKYQHITTEIGEISEIYYHTLLKVANQLGGLSKEFAKSLIENNEEKAQQFKTQQQQAKKNQKTGMGVALGGEAAAVIGGLALGAVAPPVAAVAITSGVVGYLGGICKLIKGGATHQQQRKDNKYAQQNHSSQWNTLENIILEEAKKLGIDDTNPKIATLITCSQFFGVKVTDKNEASSS